MKSLADALSDLATTWRTRAAERRDEADEARARCYERAATELETTLRTMGDEPLDLPTASRESGIPVETLRKKIARGELPQAGRRHAPKIRRADLPSRGRRPAASQYSPDDDALRLVRGS